MDNQVNTQVENKVTTEQVEDQPVHPKDKSTTALENAGDADNDDKAFFRYDTDSEEEEEYVGPVFPLMKLPPEVRRMIYSAITPDEGFEFTVKVYQDLNTLNIIPPHDDFRVLPPYGRVCREMRFAILNQYCPVVLTCEFCPRKYCRMPGPDDAEFEDVYGYLHLTKDSLTVISDNHPRWVDPPMDLEPGCEFPICLGHTTTIRVKSLDLCFSLDHWDIPGREFNMDLYDTMAPPDEALNENGNLGEIPMEFDQETESDTDAYDVYDDDEDDENDDDDF